MGYSKKSEFLQNIYNTNKCSSNIVEMLNVNHYPI